MQPLAALIRPKNLDEFIGQKHLVGPGQPVRKLIENQQMFSMILWGPPGVGKTTLAKLIAHAQKRDFHQLSAVAAGKKDIAAIVEANPQRQLGQSYDAPVVFLDEIHRFNKAQQDFLLPFVESGQILLVGATTENPSFEVNAALISRSKVFVLNKLDSEELNQIIDRVIKYLKQISPTKTKLKIKKDAREWLVNYANGDARQIINLLENSFELYEDLELKNLKNALQSTFLNYDKKGDQHYDTISAFIKSMRASDADAALYYLARMVAAGEDPKFIARRMIIFASEDIGLAAPTALVVANNVFDAVTKIGYPEAQINLAHGVAYLSRCQKNRSAYDAYFAALSDVQKFGNLEIPLEIRNAPTNLMKELEYGKGYEMYPEGRSYLPAKLKRKKYLKLKQL
jgi:putative ATPase